MPESKSKKSNLCKQTATPDDGLVEPWTSRKENVPGSAVSVLTQIQSSHLARIRHNILLKSTYQIEERTLGMGKEEVTVRQKPQAKWQIGAGA